MLEVQGLIEGWAVATAEVLVWKGALLASELAPFPMMRGFVGYECIAVAILVKLLVMQGFQGLTAV